jgi:hypothetical protein
LVNGSDTSTIWGLCNVSFTQLLQFNAPCTSYGETFTNPAKHAYASHIERKISCVQEASFSPAIQLCRAHFQTGFATASTNTGKATKLDSTPIREDGKVTFCSNFPRAILLIPHLGLPSHLAQIPFPRILNFREQTGEISRDSSGFPFGPALGNHRNACGLSAQSVPSPGGDAKGVFSASPVLVKTGKTLFKDSGV